MICNKENIVSGIVKKVYDIIVKNILAMTSAILDIKRRIDRMMRVVESIISKYYIFRNDILIDFNLIFLTIIAGILPDAKENKKQIINKLAHYIFYIFIIICLGEVASLLGLTPQIEYENFNVAIFIIVIGTILLGMLLHCIMFKDIIGPALQICKYIQYMIFFELFLLVITHHLELIEGFAGTLAIICIGMIKMFFERVKVSNEKKRIEDKEEAAKEYDYPNPDLYYARKKQLEKFVSVLEQQKYEPYAIMVSGEWGSGKSSFIKALEKKLKEDCFIWVQAGSEKTFSDTLLEISEKILEILKENNIFIESDNLIEKYFVAFSGLLDETGLKFLNIVTDVLRMNIKGDSKEYLNSKLSKLNKTVYIIIDDLDRCNEEYQSKMFKIIRESTELINCKTIFLVDKKKFLNEVYDANHIEKYISYTLDLCKGNCQEILMYHINSILGYEFFQEIKDILKKGRSAGEISSIIYSFPENISRALQTEISRLEENINNKVYDKTNNEKALEEIGETILKIEENITNSRKLKNYLKGIKRDLSNLNTGIDRFSTDFQKEDWFKAIIEVQFVKNILPEMYGDIKISRDITEFQKNYPQYSFEIIFGFKYNVGLSSENKAYVLNYIIYSLDIIDYLQVQTEREKYLAELNSERADITHVSEYIKHSRSLEDFEMVLKVVEIQKFNNNFERAKFLSEFFKVMSQQSIYYKKNNKEFLGFSQQLTSCLVNLELTETERDICLNERHFIIRRVVKDSLMQFIKILLILFQTNKVYENMKIALVNDIDSLFQRLKIIDENYLCHGLIDEPDKLVSIKRYFNNLRREIEQEEYRDLKINFEDLFKDVNIIFDICKVWKELDNNLNRADENSLPSFERYFNLQIYSFNDSVFLNVSTLFQALEVLKRFYESKNNCYKPEFSKFLLYLSKKILNNYESNSEWFEGREKEISNLLQELSEEVCKLDNATDEDGRDVIYMIRVFIFRFAKYCKDNE